MKPILEAEFHHEVRGPELRRVVWSHATPQAFEYFNPEDEYVDENLRHLHLIQVEAFAYAGEEVHGSITTTANSKAAIHDLGRSPWLQSFNPHNLDDCSHFQIMFYDEIFDVICRTIHAGLGPYVEEASSSEEPRA